MAKKYYGRRRNYGKRKTSTYSAREKEVWKKGFFAGLFTGKKKKKTTIKSKKNSKRSLMDEIKYYRDHNLGVLYRDGKYYDTNFIDRPHEIEKSWFEDLHREYNFDGKQSDISVADQYVRHMRRKYGTFDQETGKFLGLLGEK